MRNEDAAPGHGAPRTRWWRRWSGRRGGYVAVVIDCENAPVATIDEIMARAGRLGPIKHRLAFGTNAEDSKWMKARIRHAIRVCAQSRVRSGKNSADIEMTVAVMDMMHGDPSITTFCLVSSDSDFAPLAMRIREQGRSIVGYGERKTPEHYQLACTHFEIIAKPRETKKKEKPKIETVERKRPNTARTKVSRHDRREFLELVRRAERKAPKQDGWVFIGVIGARIRKIKPGISYSGMDTEP